MKLLINIYLWGIVIENVRCFKEIKAKITTAKGQLKKRRGIRCVDLFIKDLAKW